MRFSRLGIALLIIIGINAAALIGVPPSVAILAGDHTVDSPMPFFENRLETDHFVLKWTNRSRHLPDNIKDPNIIKDTGEYLEYAWARYMELFGRAPYAAPGKDKIEVVFRDIDCYGVADPPSEPIQFNSDAWVNNSGIRQPTSAHELFHKMQYAYGYKTRWHPRKPYMWFTEGTAAWAEVFVWGRVSRTSKLDGIFRDANIGLYDADDMAMPFWIYFVHGNQEHPDHQLMVRLFEECERLQDEKLALNNVIKETYGTVDAFFKDFASERKRGFWNEDCDAPYRCILGPDGRDLVKKVKGLQEGKNKG